MNEPTQHSLNYFRSMAALVERLAQQNITLRKVHVDWAAFGSWSLEASGGDEEAKRQSAIKRHEFNFPGPEVFRISWDGRDKLLSIASTPTEASVMLNKWKSRDECHTCDSYEAALSLAERWLGDRLGVAA